MGNCDKCLHNVLALGPRCWYFFLFDANVLLLFAEMMPMTYWQSLTGTSDWLSTSCLANRLLLLV